MLNNVKTPKKVNEGGKKMLLCTSERGLSGPYVLHCSGCNSFLQVALRSTVVFSVAVFPLQEEAGSLLVDLSSSLNTIIVNQDDRDDGEVVQAATPIVEAASNILNVSSNVRTKLSLMLLNMFFFT